MQRSFVIELFQKLTSKQMRELSEAVHSPFFNKNESVTRLFDYLRLYHPAFPQDKLNKEFIYAKLFSSAKYNDSFMRMIIFRLTSLAEEYLSYSDYRSGWFSENSHLVNSLLDLNLDKEAAKHISLLEKKLKQTELHNSTFFRYKYELEKFKDIIYSRTYRALTIKDKPDEKLLEESNNLIAFFLLSVLQRYRYLLNKSFSVKADYKLDFLPYIISFLESEGSTYLNNITVRILYRQIQLLKDHTREDLFDELMKELTDDRLPIDDEERRDGITVLTNYCIERIYEGKTEYDAHMFKMSIYLVGKNLYNRVKGGYFEQNMFQNIVIQGIKLGETEWTRNFIEKYSSKVSPDIRQNNYNYCLTKIYFKTGEFEKALEYISRVTYSDLHMKVNVRFTTITIHYELGNIEEVLMQLENFKKFILKDKLLSESNRRISDVFIKFVTLLCRARFSVKADLDELRNSVLKAGIVSHRTWLLRKINELTESRR